ncbi:MAG: hypothetical protein IH623_23845 [Verrucomicrobia bacterium]|nr:hypothetical protein [Verrucomicrobiota bacterium]
MNSMPLDLTRCRNSRNAGHAGYIVSLLRTLGVPKQILYVQRVRENGSFWTRRINHLEVLERARWLYRQQIACVHPDKAGGSHERTIELNNTWGKISRRFKEHGHELC